MIQQAGAGAHITTNEPHGHGDNPPNGSQPCQPPAGRDPLHQQVGGYYSMIVDQLSSPTSLREDTVGDKGNGEEEGGSRLTFGSDIKGEEYS